MGMYILHLVVIVYDYNLKWYHFIKYYNNNKKINKIEPKEIFKLNDSHNLDRHEEMRPIVKRKKKLI